MAAVDCEKQTAEVNSLPVVSLKQLEGLLESQLEWK
jgi:hypothetical protein